jgi:hypothetical protein
MAVHFGATVENRRPFPKGRLRLEATPKPTTAPLDRFPLYLLLCIFSEQISNVANVRTTRPNSTDPSHFIRPARQYYRKNITIKMPLTTNYGRIASGDASKH